MPFNVIERKLQKETPNAHEEILARLLLNGWVYPLMQSKEKAIDPNTAKNIFVFTDGRKEKKKGKRKRLVSMITTETCNAFIILN